MFNSVKKEDLIEKNKMLQMEIDELKAKLDEANKTIEHLKSGAYSAVASDISEKGKNFAAGLIKGAVNFVDAAKDTVKDIKERSKK